MSALFDVAETRSDLSQLTLPSALAAPSHAFVVSLYVPHAFHKRPVLIERGGESAAVWSAAVADQPAVLDELGDVVPSATAGGAGEGGENAPRDAKRAAFRAEYVEHCIKLAEWIRDHATGWVLRIYLAPELRWAAPALLEPGVVQLHIMQVRPLLLFAHCFISFVGSIARGPPGGRSGACSAPLVV